MSPLPTPESQIPQAPLAILQGEALFWSIFKESSDALLLLETKQLSIVDLNPAAEKMLGYSREELLERCFLPSLSETQRLYIDETHRLRAVLKVLNSSKRFTFPKSDGILLTAEGKASLVNVHSEMMILILIRGQSEQRKHEEELRQMEKLMALGQMVAGVAHEINNPLTVIKGRLDLLKITPNLPEKVKGWIAAMDVQLDRVIQMVRHFLMFARKDSVEKTPVKIQEILQRAMEFRRYEYKLSQIEIVEDFIEDLPLVLANPGQLEQVFLNIINNALHAMQTQVTDGQPVSGQLRIKTRTDGENVQVTFTDSGPGIPDAVIKHIFEPFFTTKDVGKGTGLGLSISYSIVQDHGGHLSVWNEPGAGASFMVTLPIYRETAPETTNGRPAAKDIAVAEK